METLVQQLNSHYTLKHIAIVMIICNLFAPQIMVKKLLLNLIQYVYLIEV